MPMRILRALVVPIALLGIGLSGCAYDPYTGSFYPAIYGYPYGYGYYPSYAYGYYPSFAVGVGGVWGGWRR